MARASSTVAARTVTAVGTAMPGGYRSLLLRRRRRGLGGRLRHREQRLARVLGDVGVGVLRGEADEVVHHARKARRRDGRDARAPLLRRPREQLLDAVSRRALLP